MSEQQSDVKSALKSLGDGFLKGAGTSVDEVKEQGVGNVVSKSFGNMAGRAVKSETNRITKSLMRKAIIAGVALVIAVILILFSLITGVWF
jgi:hypothetical protein